VPAGDDDDEKGRSMDSERFDGLVRSFGQTRSRRQTLRGLAGVLAVGALVLGGQEADAGKRSGGAPCTKGRQCKTGKCVGTSGAKICSCSKRYPRCTTPDTTCQEGTCTGQVAPCDGQSCDGCCDGTTCKGGDADGACGSNGEGCRVCPSFETCSDGACVCGADCVCPTLKAPCTDAEQCTEGCGGAVACGPIGNLDQDQCCRPLGGACSTPGAYFECCALVFAPGSGDVVYCGSNNTCGGPGAQCFFASTCASGVCCGMGTESVCCAAGERCENFQCTR
jgi:hypothetical protein